LLSYRHVQVTRIFLASLSPRRRELLKQLGVLYEIVLLREDLTRGADVDETPLANEAPDAYVLRMAGTKAEVAAYYLGKRTLPATPVVAGDTIVVRDGRILGKPEDREDAVRMLLSLAGREHQVLSAVAVCSTGRVERAISTSRVWLKAITEDEIRRYVATGEPMDKAGAYAIQGRAAMFVQHMQGSYSGIMGLPLAEAAELLKRAGVQVL
jgi:septum formation protein